jgi:hypothetical protein
MEIGKENLVCKLHIAFCGFKQAPIDYGQIDENFREARF